MTVDLDAVVAAGTRIAQYVRRTPVLQLNERFWLKLESLQITGSFKARGAFNHILAERTRCAHGVITASSGNHGRAVAYAARRLGLAAVVVVPEDVVSVKARAIEALGATLLRCGRSSEERLARATELAAARGLHYVPPFDDPHVIAGQGTAGVEIHEQCHAELVLVPASGGGLISGVSVALKALVPDVEIVGVEPAGANRFAQSRAAGVPVLLSSADTVADGLRVATPGHLPWHLTATCVDRFVSVGDDEILSAVRRLFVEHNLVVEPSGAASVAAAWRLNHARRVLAVVSGGNIDPALLMQLLT